MQDLNISFIQSSIYWEDKKLTVKIEERITNYDIKIDDPLASVWAEYEFYIDGKLSHKGVDAFQLFKSNAGWKIIQICDTRRK